MWKIFQDSNLSEPGQKYPHMPKISPAGLPVSSINSEHINIYIYTHQAWGQAPKGLSPLDLSPFWEGLNPDLSPPLIKGLKSGLGLKPFIDELQALFLQYMFIIMSVFLWISAGVLMTQIEHKFTLEDMNTKYGQ